MAKGASIAASGAVHGAEYSPEQPGAADLFTASLIAVAMVYGVGAVLFSAFSFLGTQSGGWLAVFKTFAMFATGGLLVAGIISFVIIAPIGTAIALAMLRITRPGWWQGPATGILVALSLEGIGFAALSAIPSEELRWEAGNLAVLLIPVVLAAFAGAYVQHKVLHWPPPR